MKPTTYTPEEQDAALPPMPGLLRRPAAFHPQPEAPGPCRRRRRAARSPEARRANVEQTRIRSARARLKESQRMLSAALASGDAEAITKARQWVTQRSEGLARVLRELGIPPAEAVDN